MYRAILSDVGMTLHLLVSIALICQSESQQTPMFFDAMLFFVGVAVAFAAETNEPTFRFYFFKVYLLRMKSTLTAISAQKSQLSFVQLCS